MSPTAAGINMGGMISIRNFPAVCTCSTLMIFRQRAASIRIRPYMLAGIGRGMTAYKISPRKVTKRMIPNSNSHFIFLFSFISTA